MFSQSTIATLFTKVADLPTYITDKVNPDQILMRYPNPELAPHLQLACAAINRVRAQIAFSTTHPSANSVSDELWITRQKELQGFRRIAGSFPYYPRELHDLLSQQMNATADCPELSVLLLYHLAHLANNQNLPMDLLFLAPGNHIFVVINGDDSMTSRNQTLAPTLIQQCPRAIVCDAWSGDVYPASELLSRLQVLQQYKNDPTSQRLFSKLVNFDPTQHKIKCCGRYFPHEIKSSLPRGILFSEAPQ